MDGLLVATLANGCEMADVKVAEQAVAKIVVLRDANEGSDCANRLVEDGDLRIGVQVEECVVLSGQNVGWTILK